MAAGTFLALVGCTAPNSAYDPACPDCPNGGEDLSDPVSGTEDMASPEPEVDLTSPEPGPDLTSSRPDLTSPRQRQIQISIPQRLSGFCAILEGRTVTRVVSEPAGIDCGMGRTACTANFPSNTAVTLRSSSNPGVSLRFSGGCTASAPPCVVAAGTSTASVNVNVDLTSMLTLTTGQNAGVSASQIGDPNSGYGAVQGYCAPRGTCCGLYPPGTSVTLASAVGTLSGGGCNNKKACMVTVNGRISVSASP